MILELGFEEIRDLMGEESKLKEKVFEALSLLEKEPTGNPE